MSLRLHHTGNSQWITQPYEFLRIEHYDDMIPGYPYRFGMYGWSVKTTDGTTYLFGSNYDPQTGEAVNDSRTEISLEVGHWLHPNVTVRRATKWYLREVIDPLGNHMVYEYDSDRSSIPGDCTLRPARESFPNLSDANAYWLMQQGAAYYQYTSATYLREVRWSGNTTHNLPHRFRVLLGREARPDWKVDGHSVEDCTQARFGYARLSTVTVQAQDATSNGNWHTLREYRLNYEQGSWPGLEAGHSLLKNIEYRGKAGAAVLHTHTFTYEGTHNSIRLQKADNGQGGTAEYSYTWINGFPCRDCARSTTYVHEIRHSDGISATTRTSYEYGGAVGYSEGPVYEFLGFGYSKQTTYTTNSDLGISNRPEQQIESWYHQLDATGLRDPRRGRMNQQIVREGSNGLQRALTITTWWHQPHSGSIWVYKTGEHLITYNANGTSIVDRTVYEYEPGYGNVIRVEDRNAENVLLRSTVTDYFPNPHSYIVNKPARVRVYDNQNYCVSEQRFVYDSLSRYNLMPNQGVLTQIQTAIDACSAVEQIPIDSAEAAKWIINIYGYDRFGNRVTEGTTGTYDYIFTLYDAFYNLFPVERHNYYQPNLREKVRYYGVLHDYNRDGNTANDGVLSVADSRAYWGQVQQFCALDGFCTVQSYDGFGRALRRWDRLTETQGWPSDANASVIWGYARYQQSSLAQKDNRVTEWRAPRCEGNFTRKLYNGFGQLIEVQTPQANWSTVIDGCGTANSTPEVVVNYAYDGLGRQVRASVPRAVNWAWQQGSNWAAGYTETWYDALGRPLRIDEPNQVTTLIDYNARATAWFVDGDNNNAVNSTTEQGDRVVRWQMLDDLGRLVLVRNFKPSNGGWLVDGEVLNTYKPGTDLLAAVAYRSATNQNYTQLSEMTYDLAGRKTSMWDANLGTWSYAYDKLSRLTRQTDARGYSTCLGYTVQGAVHYKSIYAAQTCSGTLVDHYEYRYDDLARLREIVTSSGKWSRTYAYNLLGLLSTTTRVWLG